MSKSQLTTRLISASTSHRRGVTLIDLVVTALILGILAAVTSARFADSLQYHRAQAAANRLATDLRLARSKAIQSSTPFRVQFNARKSAYSIPQLADMDHPQSRYQVDLSASPYHSNITGITLTGDLVFSIFGTCNQDGKIQIVSGGVLRTVSVNSQTGEVTLE